MDGGVCGDTMLRTMLYEAAQSMLTHSKKWSWLKAWGMRVAQRRGMRRATVAVARRLAVVLHRMWVDGTDFRWSNGSAAAVRERDDGADSGYRHEALAHRIVADRVCWPP
jgi:hypothetical protein